MARLVLALCMSCLKYRLSFTRFYGRSCPHTYRERAIIPTVFATGNLLAHVSPYTEVDIPALAIMEHVGVWRMTVISWVFKLPFGDRNDTRKSFGN